MSMNQGADQQKKPREASASPDNQGQYQCLKNLERSGEEERMNKGQNP